MSERRWVRMGEVVRGWGGGWVVGVMMWGRSGEIAREIEWEIAAGRGRSRALR